MQYFKLFNNLFNLKAKFTIGVYLLHYLVFNIIWFEFELQYLQNLERQRFDALSQIFEHFIIELASECHIFQSILIG